MGKYVRRTPAGSEMQTALAVADPASVGVIAHKLLCPLEKWVVMRTASPSSCLRDLIIPHVTRGINPLSQVWAGSTQFSLERRDCLRRQPERP